MAKVTVEYLTRKKQVIDWPDDEMEDFNYENLQCNLDPDKAVDTGAEFEICELKVNGKDHYF
ncbi:hypothetical protein [Neptuniibacter sp. QD37_11]|uniref:hypothetical protein n=1 Tax=Neptuniibacter sp. QD37_11 TaxID=3398209 RepID=UPI0039F51A32